MDVSSANCSLEKRPMTFKRVRVRLASHVFAGAVRHGAVAVAEFAEILVRLVLVRADRAARLDIGRANRFQR